MPNKPKPVGKTPTNDKSTKPVVKNSNEKKETKPEMFIRVGEPRVKTVLRSLRILGNCSNRTNYEYSSEQVESMKVSIQKAVDNMFAKFTPSKSEQETFKF